MCANAWECYQAKNAEELATFLSFCIEEYKTHKAIGGAECMQLLDSYGALDYLAKHYAVLHTQGRDWLMAELDEFISNRSK